MAFPADALDQVAHPGQVRPGEIDWEENDLQALVPGKAGRFDRQVNRPVELPAIAFFNQMRAGGDFHDDALDAGIDGAFDVIDHAAREGVDFGAEIAPR